MLRRSCLSCLLVAGIVSNAWADGLIVPVRPDIRVSGSWAVKYHKVDIKVRDQVAEVSIDQAFVNTGSFMIEVEYIFPLPPHAAINGLTLLVDGKEFTGKVLPKDEARRTYESIVRSKKDPALLEYMDYGLYKTSAFPLNPGKDVRVVVHYTDVCKRDHNLVEVFYPLNTEKFSTRPIDEVEVRADIQARGPISVVYSPTHDLDVKRPSPEQVVAVYRAEKQAPAGDFRLMYQLSDEAVGATVLSYRPRDGEDGYFLLMVSPTPQGDVKTIVPKDLVIVLDRSGSMSGSKIGQAKSALQYVLKNLNEGDRFAVVVYNDGIDRFHDALVENTPDHVKKALDMLDRVDARGGTNIHDAVAAGLKLPPAEGERPAYLLFLTDGLPTVGNTNENDILKNAKESNKGGVRIFALGVGYDVNVRLLDRLVLDNRGTSGYVKEKEPLEAKLSSLYAKLKNPVMTDLAVKFSNVRTTMTYPQTVPDLFDGDQIVLAGRYDKPGSTNVVVTGKYQGKSQTFECSADLAARSDKFSYAFVEQIWAARRIGFLLDEIQLRGKSDEVVDELVRLSKQYGIITPYTSFLADERTPIGDRFALGRQARDSALNMQSTITGGTGQMHAANRAALQQVDKGRPAASSAQVVGRSSLYAYEAEQKTVVGSVQNLANRAFYKRGRQWIDSRVADREQEKLQREAKVIRQFSEEYFKLVAANSPTDNQVLAAQRPGEEILVELRGTVYRITAE
ncbi:MAG TPA: VIT domain-containing protein [Phycisphaerae bacterium]|nr:VIT domain-containing protein [Phycisphaerae bacterium]